MLKEEMKKIFADSFLPIETLAKERFEHFLKESENQKANEVIQWILNDEIKHISMVNRVLDILNKKQ